MNAMQRELDDNIQVVLNQHLDAIESVLVESRLSRQERRSICDEVEAQATEMVWQRSEGNQPTSQLMAAVIAELDDPEAYRDGDRSSDSTVSRGLAESARLHPFALWAMLAPIFGFMVIFSPIGPRNETEAAIWFGLLVVLSVILSAIAFGDIRRQPDQYYGLNRAMFGVFEEPMAVVVVHPFSLWSLLVSIIGCVFLMFTRFGTQGAGTLLVCGILTVASIALATLAIRDIYYQPDRFYGTNLALFGASLIPVFLCLSIIVVS